MENKKKGKKSVLYYVVIAICLLLSGGLGVNSLDSDSDKENNTTIEVQEDINNIEEQEKQEKIVDNKEQVDILYEDKEENVEDTNIDSQQDNQVLEEDNRKENKQEDKQEEQSEITEIEETVAIEYTFRSEGTFQSHYEKHGIEMGFETKEDYLLAANKVILNPESLHKLEKEDGDDVYYLEESNEFVVVSKDGYIRTYFLPSAGIDYYNRQ